MKKQAAYGEVNGVAGSVLRRSTLLASVAAGALLLGASNQASAGCTSPPAVTIQCTGNVSAGIQLWFPSTTSGINVHDVTSGIATLNKDGIQIRTDQRNLTVTNNLTKPSGQGTYSIIVSGTGEYSGINVNAHNVYYYGFGASVTSTGSIVSQGGSGIRAKGDGAVSVSSTGNIQAYGDGIFAYSFTGQAVSVINTGNITGLNGAASNGPAISASSFFRRGVKGDVYVKNTGYINARSGIGAGGPQNVTLHNYGNVKTTYGTGVAASGGGTVILTSTGRIEAAGSGVGATGTTATLTNVGTVTSQNGVGISVGGGAVQLITNKDHGQYYVHSKLDGIQARANNNLEIDTTGAITSDAGNGISAIASNSGTGHLVLNSTGGKITAKKFGINAYSNARGEVKVTVDNNIESKGTDVSYDGIHASRDNRNFVSAVTVDTTGTISAYGDGIDIGNTNGDMNVINRGAITSTRAIGIRAMGGDFSGAIDIKNYAGINAGGAGIYANDVRGKVTVLNTGQISSTLFDTSTGIETRSGGVTDIRNSANITAYYSGIWARSGAGVTLSTTGNVTSTAQHAIRVSEFGTGKIDVMAGKDRSTGQIIVRQIDAKAAGIIASSESSGAIEITNYDNIHAGKDTTTYVFYARGISARSATGAITINSSGNVTSDASSGIVAWSGGANAVEVTSHGAVDAFRSGVYAYSKSGSVTLSSSGTVTTDNYVGRDSAYWNMLDAHNRYPQFRPIPPDRAELAGLKAVSSTGDVSVTDSGEIDARTNGIYAKSQGNVSVTLQSTGKITTRVSAQTYFSDGIYAASIGGRDANGTTTVKSYGVISAANDGITARGNNKGDVAVTVNNATAAYAVQAAKDAVYARNQYGAAIVHSTGNIISTGSWGVTARTFGYGKYANKAEVISNGNISADGYGIETSSRAGSATVSSTGDITTTSSSGIRATSGSGDVYVKSVGNINLVNKATEGYLQEWVPDPDNPPYNHLVSTKVTFNSVLNNGIFGYSRGGKVTLKSTGTITSDHSATGIRAFNWYDGSVEITNSGYIHSKVGVTESGRGIYAVASRGAITVTNTGKVTSDSSTAIQARAAQTGNVTITNKAALEAGRIGIYAKSAGGIIDLSTEADVTGKTGGIAVVASGAGTVTVANKANLTSANGQGIGIDANGAGKVTVNNGMAGVTGKTVNAGLAGITAANLGSGDVEITNYDVIHSGIGATGASALTAHGIAAKSTTGALTVSNYAALTSDTAEGLAAEAAGGVVSLSTEADVTGKTGGIAVTASGAGTVTVVNKANVSSSDGRGIGIGANGTGKVTVNNGVAGVAGKTVNAGLAGITAVNDGSGDVEITNYDVIHSGIDATGASALTAHGVLASSAGAAMVSNSADVTSDTAAGIVAQSSGSGAVQVTNAAAIRAQSYGIGAASASGAVTVDTSGVITANEGAGILAYTGGVAMVSVTSNSAVISSLGSGIHVAGEGVLAVTVNGAVTGAAAKAGVEFGISDAAGIDGAANRLVVSNAGQISNAGGIGEFAVYAGSGDEAVSNAGTVTGSVYLGGGNNSFDNLAGGLFEMGQTVNLGAGNTISNAGIMSVGLRGTVAQVAMTGNLTQTAGGTWAVDIDGQANAADFVSVSGTASLAGTVAVNAITAPVPKQEFLILQADGGVTDNGLALQGSVATSLQLIYRDSAGAAAGSLSSIAPASLDPVQAELIDQLWLGVSVNVAVEGLNPNQSSVARNIDTLMTMDPGGVAPVIEALIGIREVQPYQQALNELLPDPYLHLHMAMADVMSAGQFGDMLVNCKVREGAYAYIDEGQCGWMQAGGTSLKRDASGMDPGAEETGWWYSGGVQADLSDTLHLGVGARYERVSQDVQTSHAEGNRGDLGAALTYNSGPLLLSSSVSAGESWIDTDRRVAFNGFSGTARGESNNGYVRGTLRGAYLFDFGAWYLKPLADVDATWLSYGEVKEDGGHGAALEVDSSQQTVLSASPKLELGAEWTLANGVILRPYASAGATFYGDTAFSATSRFRDAPAGSPAFETRLQMDDVIADLSLGLDMFGTNGTSLRVYYDGNFGETTEMHTGGLRAAMEF